MNKSGKFTKPFAWLAALLSILAPGHAQVTRPAVTPMVVGHRGLEHHAPENTVTNFKASLQLNVGIEVDVRRSKDGVWVCLHDESLDRTTNGRGRVADHLFADLRQLDAGSHFAPYYTGERIAAFEELLVLLKEYNDRSIMVAVDLKVTDATAEKELVDMARRHGVLHQLVFIGLTIIDPSVRAKLRAADQGTQISVLAQTPADVPAALADPHANWAYLRFVPSPEVVKTIRDAGRKVFVVGNMVVGLETDNWRRAQAAGVDGIMTEFPLECRRALHLRKP